MPQIKPLRLFLLALVLSVSVAAQNLTETASKIRAAIENKDYQTAVAELEALEKTDRKVFRANNYDYLLARAAEKNGDFARAMAMYQAVANRNSVLSEYALWHLSQLARASGNLLLERIYLTGLLARAAPDDLLTDAANSRMARSYFESKNFDAVIEIAESGKRNAELKTENNSRFQISDFKIKDQTKNPPSAVRSPQSARARETSALLGQAYLYGGKPREARAIFMRLIDELPNAAQPDDFALTAVKLLDEMDGGRENFGKSAPEIAEAEHLKRAFVYQFNRNFSLARLHYQAIVKRFPQSAKAADALYQTGRGFAQEGNFNEAINWFERAQADFPQNPIAKDALSQAASTYARAGKPQVAVARYQTFIEKYADAENLDRAYLNIVDVLRDQREVANALKWSLRTQEVFKGKLPAAVALFAQARIHISSSRWKEALDDLNALQNSSDLGGARVPGGTNNREVAFMRGFVLENLSRYAEAIEVYLSIPDGRNEYYGWRATEKLKLLAINETSKPAAETKLTSLLKQLSDAQSTSPGDFPLTSVMQNVLRLTNNIELRASMLQKIKTAYEERSDKTLTSYKIPNFKLLEFGRKEVLKEKRAVANENHHRTLADELLFLGLYDEGAPELETSLMENGKRKMENAGNNPKSKVENPKSEDVAYTLAVFYRRGDMAHRAVAFAEPLWKNVPADYQIELIPREQIELLYPAPFVDALLRYAPEREVDARFLLSIMRQESRFRSEVKSNAAARGLMQFISTTGEKLAAELGRKNFKQDELYNPPTAILFGAQYLSNLFKLFPDQPQAVAASYNGGEDNVLRWVRRAGALDADRYLVRRTVFIRFIQDISKPAAGGFGKL